VSEYSNAWIDMRHNDARNSAEAGAVLHREVIDDISS